MKRILLAAVAMSAALYAIPSYAVTIVDVSPSTIAPTGDNQVSALASGPLSSGTFDIAYLFDIGPRIDINGSVTIADTKQIFQGNSAKVGLYSGSDGSSNASDLIATLGLTSTANNTWTYSLATIGLEATNSTSYYIELNGSTVGSGTVSPVVSLSAVGNIPEPSTWAMMGLGFAGLAFAGYRNRRSVAAIA